MEKWWKERVFYQIYPRSFCDSDGNGIGDICGIISRLDYLKELGIGALWLSPLYKSPNDDNGYDISDYLDINPEYGTMDDFKRLLKEAAARDIKIIMDLVINHTSDEHRWFQESLDPQSPYRDWYYWRPGRKNGKPPNNWTSFFSGPAWEARGDEYYLHLFSKKQPDLNYHNPEVLREIKRIMKFYLDMGVAGFRCDVINVIYKTALENGKRRLALTGREHYLSQTGCHEILKEIRRDVLSGYDCFTVGETVMVTPETARMLTGPERGELDTVFTFEHMETDQIFVKWFKAKFRPHKLIDCLAKWQGSLEWNALYFENHDQPRSVSRFGSGAYRELSAKALATVLLTLKGVPFIYEGQEIGMTNGDFKDISEFRDVETHNIYRLAKRLRFPRKYIRKMVANVSRDNARTPMQWSGAPNAGFTAGEPWLKVNGNYKEINAERQLAEAGSVLNYYKSLIALRASSAAFTYGGFLRLPAPRGVFAYVREHGGERFTVVCNLTAKAKKLNAPVRGVIAAHNRGLYGETEIRELKPYDASIVRV